MALLAASGRCGFSADEFGGLVNLVPRSANAVVLLNVENAKQSPYGIKEGWKDKLEKAFEEGLIRVPRRASRFVLAAQLDYELKEPLWEAAVMDLDAERSIEQFRKRLGGEPDRIEGWPALARPNNTYLVQLGPQRIGAMGPGNRQAVVRWAREMRSSSPPPLSPYLQQAARYSDQSGSEIIMALDLDSAMSFERVGKYLKSREHDLQEWRAKATGSHSPLNLPEMAATLSGIRGIRIGVRLREEPAGMVVVDLHGDAAAVAPVAKPLLMQAMADAGALIDDFQSWTIRVQGSEISLAGGLSPSGLRRLLSVVDSPANADAAETAGPGDSPGDPPASKAEKSREYFRSVVAMAGDVKGDMKNLKTLASAQYYFDKYAKRIERMPILDVDDDLLDYGAFVARALRQATGAVKTMGIQSGVRQAQYSSDYWDYGYGRRAVRAEEKGRMATDVNQLRHAIIMATTEIRRKMTKKYQIEF